MFLLLLLMVLMILMLLIIHGIFLKFNLSMKVLMVVDFPAELLARLGEASREAAIGVLANDPRPSYQHDEERIYGLPFAGFDIRFRVEGQILHVLSVEKLEQ